MVLADRPSFVGWLVWISLASMILAGVFSVGFGGCPWLGGRRLALTESLILAQDERWRRA
jgi:hypothetical protein